MFEGDNSNDRQDKGADHYSDMIRNPNRSVKVYNKLMWNERRQQMDLNEIDRIRRRSLNETRKVEKVYLERLNELNETKRATKTINNARSTLLSIAVRDKRALSAKGRQQQQQQDAKPITIYQMHLIDSKKLLSKAKEFIQHLDDMPLNQRNSNDTSEPSATMYQQHQQQQQPTFDKIQPKTPVSLKPKSGSGFKTPATTPLFSTEVRQAVYKHIDQKATNDVFTANKPSIIKRNINNNNVTQVTNKKVQIFNKTMIDEGFN